MTNRIVFQVCDRGILRHNHLEKTSPACKAIMVVFEAERQFQRGNKAEQITTASSVVFQVCDGGNLRQIQLKKTSPAYRAIMAIFEAEWKRTHRLSKGRSTGTRASSRTELKGLEPDEVLQAELQSPVSNGSSSPLCTCRCSGVLREAVIQKDSVIVITARAKPHAGELKAEWFKDDKPIRCTDRVKISQKKGTEGTQYMLTIAKPTKKDEATYRIVIKSAEASNQHTLRLVCG